LVIGHRGCAGEAPENTLPSFRRALEQGATVLESDVHLTRDGVPVLIHDERVDRVSEGSGRVADYDLAGLQALDAGFRFTPDAGRTHPFRGRGLRIPSLEEAFAALPGARFNLELKEDLPGLVERTLELVGRTRREGLTLLTAAEDALMARLRAALRAAETPVAVGASAGDVVAFVRAAREEAAPAPGPMALQIPREFGGQPLVTRELVAHAHRHGVEVHVWTINDPHEMRELFELGVDGIVSDFPGRLAQVVRAWCAPRR
jgi:glycerophosphoryl diester phosphodiesterase